MHHEPGHAAVVAAAVAARWLRLRVVLRRRLLHRVAHAQQLAALVPVALQTRRQGAGAVRGRGLRAGAHERHGRHHGRQVGVLAHLVPEGRVGVAEVVLARLVQAVPVFVGGDPGRELAPRVRQVRCSDREPLDTAQARRTNERRRESHLESAS